MLHPRSLGRMWTLTKCGLLLTAMASIFGSCSGGLATRQRRERSGWVDLRALWKSASRSCDTSSASPS